MQTNSSVSVSCLTLWFLPKSTPEFASSPRRAWCQEVSHWGCAEERRAVLLLPPPPFPPPLPFFELGSCTISSSAISRSRKEVEITATDWQPLSLWSCSIGKFLNEVRLSPRDLAAVAQSNLANCLLRPLSSLPRLFLAANASLGDYRHFPSLPPPPSLSSSLFSVSF